MSQTRLAKLSPSKPLTFTQQAWFGVLPSTPRADEAVRAAVNCPQAKAHRCEPLTGDELALLSHDDLIAFEERARSNASRSRSPYKRDDDSDLWAGEYEAMATSAREELSRRVAVKVA